MTATPQLSIIIPAWNAAKTIRQTIGSIIAQTFSDWEIIIVNDGSTDDTGAVIASLSAGDPRIRHITTGNQGAYLARLTGTGHAAAPWITFADSDDTFENTDFETLMQIARDAGDCDIAVGTLRFDGETHRKGKKYVHRITGKIDSRTYQEALLSGRTSVGPYAKIYRASLFEEAKENLRATRFEQNEDFLMLLKLSRLCGNGIYIDPLQRPVYTYYRRRGSISESLTEPSAWNLLFDEIRKSLFHSIPEESLLRYQARTLYEQCIIKGQRLKSFERYGIVSSVTKGLSKACLSRKERTTLLLLRHPALASMAHSGLACMIKTYRWGRAALGKYRQARQQIISVTNQT